MADCPAVLRVAGCRPPAAGVDGVYVLRGGSAPGVWEKVGASGVLRREVAWQHPPGDGVGRGRWVIAQHAGGPALCCAAADAVAGGGPSAGPAATGLRYTGGVSVTPAAADDAAAAAAAAPPAEPETAAELVAALLAGVGGPPLGAAPGEDAAAGARLREQNAHLIALVQERDDTVRALELRLADAERSRGDLEQEVAARTDTARGLLRQQQALQSQLAECEEALRRCPAERRAPDDPPLVAPLPLPPAAKPKAKVAPPPAPPPPPPGYMDALHKGAAAPKPGGKSALFAALSQGEGITKGLRKVERAQMTHKNRDQGKVGAATDFAALEAKKAALAAERERRGGGGAATAATPARLELEGKAWKVEGQAGTRAEQKRGALGASAVDRSHAVHVSDCRDYLLDVEGKVNSVVMSGCVNTQLILNGVVAAVELVGSRKVDIQAAGPLPSLFVEKCDEVMLYASEESRGVTITTCASTCVNVTFPDEAGGDADPVEAALPEQYTTKLVMTAQGPRAETVPTSHAD